MSEEPNQPPQGTNSTKGGRDWRIGCCVSLPQTLGLGKCFRQDFDQARGHTSLNDTPPTRQAQRLDMLGSLGSPFAFLGEGGVRQY